MMTERYSQGSCSDGAAILKDGQVMSIDGIVEDLNLMSNALDSILAQYMGAVGEVRAIRKAIQTHKP